MSDLIRVINNDTGSVSYTTPKVTRVFAIKGGYKDVTIEELHDAFNELGVRVLFEDGLLLIKDQKVRDEFDLPELGDYIKDTEQMKEMLKGPKDVLEDFLQFCSETMLAKLVDVTMESEGISMEYVLLVEKYSGKEVSEAIKEKDEIIIPKKTARKIVTSGEEGRKPRG